MMVLKQGERPWWWLMMLAFVIKPVHALQGECWDVF
jgi:hypothetical protein